MPENGALTLLLAKIEQFESQLDECVVCAGEDESTWKAESSPHCAAHSDDFHNVAADEDYCITCCDYHPVKRPLEHSTMSAWHEREVLSHLEEKTRLDFANSLERKQSAANNARKLWNVQHADKAGLAGDLARKTIAQNRQDLVRATERVGELTSKLALAKTRFKQTDAECSKVLRELEQV